MSCIIGLPAKIIRDIIPDYLKSVPLPRSISDIGNMSATDLLHLVAFTGAIAGTVHYGILPLVNKKAEEQPSGKVNTTIHLESPKVVHVVNVADMGDKTCYCRCWKSKNFPLCDGSHNKHNEDNNDNTGPLVVKK